MGGEAAKDNGWGQGPARVPAVTCPSPLPRPLPASRWPPEVVRNGEGGSVPDETFLQLLSVLSREAAKGDWGRRSREPRALHLKLLQARTGSSHHKPWSPDP